MTKIEKIIKFITDNKDKIEYILDPIKEGNSWIYEIKLKQGNYIIKQDV